MQAGKGAIAAAKEAAGNIAASATSGMEKTKAVVQEKVDKLKAHDPTEEEMAEERKLERLRQAEFNKQQAMEHNLAVKEQTRPGGMSALPGHGTGRPAGGNVTEGVVPAHPIGTATGTQRTAAAHSTQAGSTNPGSHGTGGTYS